MAHAPKNSPKSAGPAGDKKSAPPKRPRRGIVTRLRNYLLAGILVTAPFAITIYLGLLFVNFVDGKITPLIPPRYNPETYLPFGVPGLGLLVLFLCLIVVGWLTPGILGRQVVRLGERMLSGMPVIRSIYGATKQIVETIMSRQKNAFREVVLFEYPRRGSWALGFITGITEGEVQSITTDDTVNVFLPTTPNPTSGYLLFVPRKELVILDMTVEEGIKMVISGGIVTPPDRRSDGAKEQKLVGPVDDDKPTVPYKAPAARPTKKSSPKKVS